MSWEDFAEGFASSFVPTFQQSTKAAGDRENELLRDRLVTFRENRKEIEKRERNEQVAKSTVAEYGFDLDSWVNVYNWLEQGRTIESIRNDLDGASFSAAPNAARPAAAPTAAPQTPAAGTDGQMQELGMTEEGAAATTAPAEDENLSWRERRLRVAEENRDRRATERLGVSEERYSEVMTGSYTSPTPTMRFVPAPDRRASGRSVSDLGDALTHRRRVYANPDSTEEQRAEADALVADRMQEETLKYQARDSADEIPVVTLAEDGTATYGIARNVADTNGRTNLVDPRGQVLPQFDQAQNVGTRPEMDGERAERLDIVARLDDEFNKYENDFNKAASAVTLAGDLVDLYRESGGDVMTSTANLVAGARSAATSLNVLVDVAGELLSSRGENDLLSLEEYEEELIARGIVDRETRLSAVAEDTDLINLPEGVDRLARQTQLFNAKMVLMAFRAGGLEGQTGAAMSNRDFDRLKEMLTGGTATFETLLGDYITDNLSALNRRHRQIVQFDGQVNAFRQTYGYSPLQGDRFVESMDSYVASGEADARFMRGWDMLFGEPAQPVQDNEVRVGTPQPEPMPIEEAITLLRQNPDALQFFIETYGEENLPEDLRGGQ